MTDKIQEITEKIYNEGVIKAKADADLILADAKTKAEEIITSAKKESAKMISNAEKQAVDIQQKTETEIQLAARKFTSNLKQQTVKTITTLQVKGHVKNAFNDTDFIKRIIQTIIQKWNPTELGEVDLKVLLPEKDLAELKIFFDEKLKELLNNGVELLLDQKIESGFKIGPQDGSYILSFTDKDFENYFKRYFSDRTKKLLFDSVEFE